MLTGQDILFIANDWFRDNKTSHHHLAEVLARHNKLLYVEAAGMRAPQGSKRDLVKLTNKLGRFWRKPYLVQENLFLYSPLILPYHSSSLARWFNKMMLGGLLKQACKTVGFRRPLIWIFMPHYASVLKTIDCKGVVYYVTDEYSAAPGVEADIVRQYEQEVLSRADVVFAVSTRLREAKAKLNPNTYLSRHGVDVDFFLKARERETEIPLDVANIHGPIAGFFGLIAEWVDLELIAYAAEKLPHVSFVLIGRSTQDPSRAARHQNVHFLGSRPYSTLPGYLKAFDVGLLPYKHHRQVEYSNPKKLREYLAGGKPVVSVSNPEVEVYGDLVYVAKDYDEYVSLIELAIERDSPVMSQRRVDAMRVESWEAKVEQLSQIIQRHIPDTGGPE
jgi:hypothetical protein